jgi:2-C-methyl-D-erythritol 4-phosphate cytidylyltransferase
VGGTRELCAGSAKPRSVVAGERAARTSVRRGLDALPAGFDGVVARARRGAPAGATPPSSSAWPRPRATPGAAIPSCPSTDTIKRVEDGIVRATVDRSALAAAQTPQGFP